MATTYMANGVETASDGLADKTSLKRKLARATLRQKLRALALVAPLLIFIVVTFLVPIGQMLLRSVENDIVVDTLPRTVSALADWDPAESELPPEAAFAAMIADLREAFAERNHTRVGQRLNYERSGVSSLFRKTPRRIAPRSESRLAKVDADIAERGAMAVLADVDEDWVKPAVWRTIKLYDNRFTSGYFTSALDARLTVDGPELKPEGERIYLELFGRTLFMSVLITLMTLLLGYPIAYLMATLPLRISNLLLILVLLPFWTSLLVRTSAWIVLLQNQGVVNDILVGSGLNTPLYNFLSLFTTPEVASLCQNNMTQLVNGGVDATHSFAARTADLTLSSCAREVIDVFNAQGGAAALEKARAIQAAGEAGGYGDERFTMIFNQTGTIIAMTHILLPFMVLPLYSVMQTIPPSYLRAAKSLGASNVTAFLRVYFPNTIPGIGAGAVLVFILSIGYYITPELVGGNDGVFISNRIAYHISSSLNWGLAAALAALLLFAVLVLYYVYDRLVGIDNVKLG